MICVAMGDMGSPCRGVIWTPFIVWGWTVVLSVAVAVAVASAVSVAVDGAAAEASAVAVAVASAAAVAVAEAAAEAAAVAAASAAAEASAVAVIHGMTPRLRWRRGLALSSTKPLRHRLQSDPARPPCRHIYCIPVCPGAVLY